MRIICREQSSLRSSKNKVLRDAKRLLSFEHARNLTVSEQKGEKPRKRKPMKLKIIFLIRNED